MTSCVHRKPKVEKTRPDKEALQQKVPKKKKGFLPETKKRKRRDIPVLEPAAALAAAADGSTPTPGADGGVDKKKHDKNGKQKRAADGGAEPNPAKKSKKSRKSRKSEGEAPPTEGKKTEMKKKKKKKRGGGEPM